MKIALQSIINRLNKNEYKNEEHIRLALVCRLLQELGWDIWNPSEVFTEFQAMRSEDATRVDIALFMPPQMIRPAVFIEVKALGKLIPALANAELQVRDYNRNNQADLSVLTDGQFWRFYLPSASGEFHQKCFKAFDLLEGNSELVDTELALYTFLSKQSLQSGSAVEEARRYLKRTDTERIMVNVLPIAKRDAEEDPSISFAECFQKRCHENGIDCNYEDAILFIKNTRDKMPPSNSSSVSQRPQEIQDIIKTKQNSPKFGEKLHLNNKRGANATGCNTEGKGFVVFAGSVAAEPTAQFEGSSLDLFKRLVRDQILVEESLNGQRVFRLFRDYEFNTSSAAASVFCGCSASGPREWK